MKDIVQSIDRRLKEIDEYMESTDQERGRHITAADELMSAMRHATEDRNRLMRARDALTADDTQVVMPGDIHDEDTRLAPMKEALRESTTPYIPGR